MSSAQLPLGFGNPRASRFEDYIVGSNGDAVDLLARAARFELAEPVFLSGPEGSGKSHLLAATCLAAAPKRAQYLSLVQLGAAAEAALIALEPVDLIAIDAIEAIAGALPAEIALFDAYNRARDAGAMLVMAARQRPSLSNLRLPDLVSRLSAATQLALEPLAEAERRDVLRERGRTRGIELDDDVLDFLFRRHARDLGALLALLERIDRESLAAQRRITVPFLRRIMGLPSRGL